MKLFYAPGACSIGIHVILEEIGKPYEAEALKLNEPASREILTAINPKTKVPTLVRDDGSVLTEFPAIATWLARTNPAAQLMPTDPDGEARVFEAMDYAVSTIHMQAFSRLFRPANYTANTADHDAVKAQGAEMARKSFELMDKSLAGHDWIAGDYSVADAALFYVEFWAADRMKLPLPANCAAHLARMKARPAVASVLQKEGFAS